MRTNWIKNNVKKKVKQVLIKKNVEVDSKMCEKSIQNRFKKGCGKCYATIMQKTSKSDVPDLAKSSKTIVLSSISVVLTHVH